MGLSAVDSRWAEADRHKNGRLPRLRAIIEKESLKRGEFTLSSGRVSNYLFQLRQTTLHPEGATLIGELVSEFMEGHGLKCVGGLELGAVPIVTAVAQASFRMGYPIEAFFVRKEPKPHGAKERIDGFLEGASEALIVDDVTTSGASMLKAIDAIRQEGYAVLVTKALAIVDRNEGAREALALQGIEFFSLLDKSEFGL